MTNTKREWVVCRTTDGYEIIGMVLTTAVFTPNGSSFSFPVTVERAVNEKEEEEAEAVFADWCEMKEAEEKAGIEADAREEAWKQRPYSRYTHKISTEPSHYGSDCSQADADQIVERLGNMVREQFPGIGICIERTACPGRRATTGPDKAVCEDIDRWVSEHWTAACVL
jgi:hypothetical protein